jgi:hypothetical protein
MPEPVLEIEREQIFTLQNLKWREGEQIIMASRYSWASPPKHLATLACSRDLADVPGSARAKKMAEVFGVSNAVTSPDLCISLDTIDQAEQPPGALPPGFEERIGQPRQILVDANRVG